jgi:hypothetical protein
MEAVEGEAAKIVAVLHDVVEDTAVTMEDLRRDGFSAEVLEALALVTHRKDEPYADYVVRAKANALARRVKLADLADNCRLERCILRPASVQRDLARVHRYLLSYKFLTDQIGEEQYRGLMAGYGAAG